MVETRRNFNEDEERELSATQSFRSLNYWNLDREPAADDKLHKAMAWIDVAKTVQSFMAVV